MQMRKPAGLTETVASLPTRAEGQTEGAHQGEPGLLQAEDSVDLVVTSAGRTVNWQFKVRKP